MLYKYVAPFRTDMYTCIYSQNMQLLAGSAMIPPLTIDTQCQRVNASFPENLQVKATQMVIAGFFPLPRGIQVRLQMPPS